MSLSSVAKTVNGDVCGGKEDRKADRVTSYQEIPSFVE